MTKYVKPLTGNQIIAKMILGYVPRGYVLCAEAVNSGARYPVGIIYVAGRAVASVPASLHGGWLPN